VFRPEEGQLAGVSWNNITPDGLRRGASSLRRDALQAFKDAGDLDTIGPSRADAVVALLSGDADGAISRLSKALERAPLQPILWSDLAAAHLQRGAAFADPYDFVTALTAANRACHLDPDLRAARFNRALALQRLSLYERARADWEVLRTTEYDPHWRHAARIHADALVRSSVRVDPKTRLDALERAVGRGDPQQAKALVMGSPQYFREYLESHLLAAWADAWLAGHSAEAERLLAVARTIGQVLATGNGEWMGADMVAQIDRLRGDASGLAARAHALEAYGRGVSQLQKGDIDGALPALQTARRRLTSQHSPLAGWASFRLAVYHYRRSEYPAALAFLQPLTQDFYRDRYPALHGQAFYLIGLIAVVRGDPTASLTASQEALADFKKLGEAAYAARVTSTVATSFDFLGMRSEAWRQLYPALIDPATLDVPAEREVICVVAAWLATGDGETEIALWFQEERLRNSMKIGDPYRIVEARRGRGEILEGLGDRTGAAQDFALARDELRKISDPRFHDSMDGDLKLAEARLAASPAEKIALLDEVIPILRSTSYQYRLAQALLARARAYEALGRSDDAARDLSAAIAECERQRTKIPTSEEQISYFDRTRDLFDAMIELHAERLHQPAEAFRFSERAKARVLLDWVLAQPIGQASPESTQERAPLSTDPAELQRQIPPGTAVIEYWLLPRSAQVWVLRRDHFAAEAVPIGAKKLGALSRRLQQELAQGRRAEALATSSELFELLIRPIARHLTPADRLVVVPDGALHGLPFALLRDSRSGRYLIQDHVCSVAPSVRLLIASLRRAGELASSQPPRALVMEDPAFDSSLFYSIPRLRASHLERVIPGLFPGSRMLREEAATRSAFLDSASDFEILHFGGHSLVNARYPLLSQMLFAPDKDDRARGVLHSGDLLGRRFAHTRLAVLASCSTAAGRISSTEGVESLARPFLAAGVPEVVASLWDVDDPPTAEFFARFYHHLAQRFDVAGALQATQVEALEHGMDPKAWGAFEVIGGSATDPRLIP
jgi:CHAT domain-containing protein